MSSYVFMKILESAPHRYDRGLRILTRGRITDIYEQVAGLAASPGARILDIGCGTGGLALACAERGATVVGIDINAGMLEVARSKPLPANSGGSVEWVELGAVEIEDRFGEAAFDAVVSCLAFSELSRQEQGYVLKVIRSRLKVGGKLVVADEVPPTSAARRFWHRVARWPVAVVTYALTQATTRPVAGLVARVREAGFTEIEETRLWSGDFAIVCATRKQASP
jgi:demethylmenaquinone methyltransferase/2-methoxy-6-polyprenyl-1,4-benzoquinol methylase